MARIRSIKPEFWHDQELTRLPRDVRMLYVALWNQCDEEGRMQGDPRLVKSWCFPLDDDVTADVIDGWLTQLEAMGKVIRYTSDGSVFLWLPKLGEHQKLDPRLRSRLPRPPAGTLIDTDSTEIHTDQSGRTGVSNTGDTPTEQGAGSRGQGAGGGRDSPLRTCAAHANHPDPPPCVPCKNARLAREAWEKQQQQHEADKRLQVSRCRLCDGDGYRLEPGRRTPMTPYVRCDHQEQQEHA